MRDYLILSADGIFASVQGEGLTMGEPAIFLRLNECNLDCTFCDTAYTWKRELAEYHQRRKVPIDEVRRAILGCPESSCRRLILTGGEPLLQAAELAALVGADPFPEWKIEIETNGTFVPTPFRNMPNVQINCSPKLRHSGVAAEQRIVPSVLEELASTYNANFKFVVRNAADVDEIVETFLPIFGSFPAERILVSPEGVDAGVLDDVLAEVTPPARRHGFAVGDRLHIRLYGNRRRT